MCWLCFSYWRTDDKPIRSLSLKERQSFLLLQRKHDDRQSEDQSLSWSSEGDSNHVSTWKTTDKQGSFKCTEKIKFTLQRLFSIYTYTVGIPCIWIGVGWTIPFFFKPFRIAAAKTNTDLLSVDDHCEPRVSVLMCWAESAVTWWKLHLSEAFDRSRNAIAINQDVKFLPDAFMSGVWHIQDVAWCFPAIQ